MSTELQREGILHSGRQSNVDNVREIVDLEPPEPGAGIDLYGISFAITRKNTGFAFVNYYGSVVGEGSFQILSRSAASSMVQYRETIDSLVGTLHLTQRGN